MPTPGEKKALLFLSAVAVLGSAARLVSASQVPVPTQEELAALQTQLRVVDSARAARRGEGTGGKRKASARSRAAPGRRPPEVSPPAVIRPPRAPIDVDVATVVALESLPGIGPALARRIVAARDSSGQFGSLDELQARVRGVGPVLARRIAPDVTFSGPRRPSSAERTEPFGSEGTTARRAKRRRGH